MEILTRKEAAQKKLHKYYTGKECIRGHRYLRYTNTAACVECIAENARQHRMPKSYTIRLTNPQDIQLVRDFVDKLNYAASFKVK